jgi:hypothetical protein
MAALEDIIASKEWAGRPKDLPSGARTVAASQDDDDMAAVVDGEPVGRAVRVDGGRFRLRRR